VSDELDLEIRCLDPRLGFLLKRMDHPDIAPELYGINGSIRVAAMSDGKFLDPRLNPLQRLRVRRKTAIR
jgi:hypothetical protein